MSSMSFFFSFSYSSI